jgi:hypothetical protein
LTHCPVKSGRLLCFWGVKLRPWRSLEVRGSPELQNGGPRGLAGGRRRRRRRRKKRRRRRGK